MMNEVRQNTTRVYDEIDELTFIYMAVIKLDWNNKYMIYEIQPTSPARRLAANTQKVGYDQQRI